MPIFRLQGLIPNRYKILKPLKQRGILEILLLKCVIRKSSVLNIEPDTHIAAVEFMDHTTLECIRRYRQTNRRLREIPEWETGFVSAVYLEIHGNSNPDIEALAEWLLAAAVEHGSDPDASWAFSGVTEMERLRLFRHAAPESVNQLIDQARQQDPRIARIDVDMRFRQGFLSHVLEMYAGDLKAWGLKAAIFGHAADRHLHVNILPQSGRQFDRGKALVESWAQKNSAMGCSVVTEHGVGKIKKHLLRSIPLPERIKLIHNVKRQLDPIGLLNPGNMPCK